MQIFLNRTLLTLGEIEPDEVDVQEIDLVFFEESLGLISGNDLNSLINVILFVRDNMANSCHH